MHINLKRKVKKSAVAKNGTIELQSEVKSQPGSVAEIKQTNNGYANTSEEPKTRSSSPYPMVRSQGGKMSGSAGWATDQKG